MFKLIGTVTRTSWRCDSCKGEDFNYEIALKQENTMIKLVFCKTCRELLAKDLKSI